MKRLTWLAIFALFLTLRLWSGYPEVFIGSDDCTYLHLARHAPLHLLYNHDLYLIHPPAFDLLLGAFTRVFAPLTAGFAVSLGAAVAFFFVLRALAVEFGLGEAGAAVALFYLAVSKAAVIFDTQIGRTAWMVVLFGATLLFFLREMKRNPQRFPFKSAACLVLALASTDQALFLLPALALIYRCKFYRQGGRRAFAGFMAIGVLAACVWPTMRACIYLNNDLYPAGIDGTIESVRPLNWKAVLQPNFLPQTYFYRAHFTAPEFAWRYFSIARFFDVPFSIVQTPKWLTQALLSLLLIASAAVMLHRRRADLLALGGCFVLFYLPCLFKMHDRYGMAYLTVFPLLLGFGVDAWLSKHAVLRFGWLASLSGLCLVLMAVWLSAAAPASAYSLYQPHPGRFLLFQRHAVARGMHFAQNALKPLPKDGVMAPVGLVPPLLYYSQKRALALPFDAQMLAPYVRRYDVHYLVLSDENLRRIGQPSLDHAMSRDVAEAIQKDPQLYRPAGIFQEPASNILPAETFYLFEVNQR